MDILEQSPKDFRYYLMYTEDKEIIIIYHKNASYFQTDDEETQIETAFIPHTFKDFKIDPNHTIKETCNYNFLRNDDFNTKIVEYCDARRGAKQVRIYNTQPTFKMLFQEKVFDAICNCTKDLYVEIGDSGLRISDAERPELDKLYIHNAKLYPNKAGIINAKETTLMDIDVTAEHDTDELRNLNFVISTKMTITRFRQYAPIKIVITSGNQSPEEFGNSAINIATLQLYGVERNESDISKHRISVLGIKTFMLGDMTVDKSVTYGNILYVDRVTSFTITQIDRVVDFMEAGSFVTIDRVGTVSLHNLNYQLTKDSQFTPNTAMITFLRDTSGDLQKKIMVYNTNIQNKSEYPITLIRVQEMPLEMILFSECTLSDGLTLIEKDDKSTIKNVIYNGVNINVSNKFVIDKVQQVSLNNCIFNAKGSEIVVDCPKIIVEGGRWEFGKVTLQSSEGQIIKVAIANGEFTGDSFEIINNNDEYGVVQCFENKSKFRVKKVLVSGLKPTFNGTLLQSERVTFVNGSVSTFPSVSILPMGESFVLELFSSITGKFIFIDEKMTGKTVSVKIQDKYKAFNINTIDFESSFTAPKVDVLTNVPFKSQINNWDEKYFYISYTGDYDSQQNSKVTFIPKLAQSQDYKVLTNSEKLVRIKDSYKDLNGFTVFEAEKK